MKPHILMIATELPRLAGGAPARNFHLLVALAATQKYRLTVVAISSQPEAAQRLARQLGIEVQEVAPVHRKRFKDTVAGVVTLVQPSLVRQRASKLGATAHCIVQNEAVHVVLFEQTFAAYACAPFLKRWREQGIRLVLDAHNQEALALAGGIRTMNWPQRMSGLLVIPRLARLEQYLAARCDVVTASSPIDQLAFSKVCAITQLVPNGATLPSGDKFKSPSGHHLLFMGGTSYPPNADAIIWYLQAIHPLVKAEVPEVTVTIIGGKVPKWLSQLAANDNTIKLAGFVPTTEPYLRNATIGLCPIRQGSGTRLKLLEYWAAGLPTVTTSKGAEGLSYRQNSDVLVANSAHDFAQAVIRLCRDRSLAEQLSRNGQALVAKHYNWTSSASSLEAAFIPGSLVARRRPSMITTSEALAKATWPPKTAQPTPVRPN